MKREAYRHPKMFDLAARLTVAHAHAVGLMDLLLDFAADSAPQGNIGKWPDGAIARAVGWTGSPTDFVDALVSSGWLDRDASHRLVIHDLKDHAERWWVLKLERLGLPFIEPSIEPSIDASIERTANGSTERSTEIPPLETPPNQTKPNQTKPQSAPSLPDGLRCEPFESSWNEWLGYRRARRLTMRPETLSKQLASLATLGPQQAAACIQLSIRSGWQGVFPERMKDGRKTEQRRYGSGQRYSGE